MFREITLNDKTWMDHCQKHALQQMTVVSFPAVYTWQSTFGLTFDGDSRFYVVRSEADNGYYYPVGDTSACRAYIRSLLQSTGRQNHSKAPFDFPDHPPGSLHADASPLLKLVYVPEQELEWLESLGFDIVTDRNTSEYIYSSRTLALLDDKASRNYKEKIRHFSRDNEWSVRPLSFPEEEAFLYAKADELANASLLKNDPEDFRAVLCAAKNPGAIGMSGIYVETAAHEWAFLLGYPSTDRIYDLTFIKYSLGMSRNVVPVCFSEMAKLVCGTWPLINLEDDMGIEGLRNMKTLYHPLCLLDSYTACKTAS